MQLTIFTLTQETLKADLTVPISASNKQAINANTNLHFSLIVGQGSPKIKCWMLISKIVDSYLNSLYLDMTISMPFVIIGIEPVQMWNKKYRSLHQIILNSQDQFSESWQFKLEDSLYGIDFYKATVQPNWIILFMVAQDDTSNSFPSFDIQK